MSTPSALNKLVFYHPFNLRYIYKFKQEDFFGLNFIFIFRFVQGITEFLPISSSGHIELFKLLI